MRYALKTVPLRRWTTAVIAAGVLFMFPGMLSAVPPGGKVEFAGGSMGKVVFDGKFHAEKGKVCTNCHSEIFQYKKGTAKITLADHQEGKKFCFACHNGTIAYNPKDNCTRCHRKG